MPELGVDVDILRVPRNSSNMVLVTITWLDIAGTWSRVACYSCLN